MSGETRLFLGGRVTPVMTVVMPWPIPAVREGLSRCSMVQTGLYKDLVRLLHFYEDIFPASTPVRRGSIKHRSSTNFPRTRLWTYERSDWTGL